MKIRVHLPNLRRLRANMVAKLAYTLLERLLTQIAWFVLNLPHTHKEDGASRRKGVR